MDIGKPHLFFVFWAADSCFLLFKEQGPFKFLKQYPAAKHRINTYQQVLLLTNLSYRWTVPLSSISTFKRLKTPIFSVKMWPYLRLVKGYLVVQKKPQDKFNCNGPNLTYPGARSFFCELSSCYPPPPPRLNLQTYILSLVVFSAVVKICQNVTYLLLGTRKLLLLVSEL